MTTKVVCHVATHILTLVKWRYLLYQRRYGKKTDREYVFAFSGYKEGHFGINNVFQTCEYYNDRHFEPDLVRIGSLKERGGFVCVCMCVWAYASGKVGTSMCLHAWKWGPCKQVGTYTSPHFLWMFYCVHNGSISIYCDLYQKSPVTHYVPRLNKRAMKFLCISLNFIHSFILWHNFFIAAKLTFQFL